jgi:hypothetical protein
LYHHDFTVVLINEKEISSAWLDRQAGASIWARKKMKFLEKWLEVLCLFFVAEHSHGCTCYENLGPPLQLNLFTRNSYDTLTTAPSLFQFSIRVLLNIFCDEIFKSASFKFYGGEPYIFHLWVKSMHRKPPRTSK